MDHHILTISFIDNIVLKQLSSGWLDILMCADGCWVSLGVSIVTFYSADHWSFLIPLGSGCGLWVCTPGSNVYTISLTYTISSTDTCYTCQMLWSKDDLQCFIRSRQIFGLMSRWATCPVFSVWAACLLDIVSSKWGIVNNTCWLDLVPTGAGF